MTSVLISHSGFHVPAVYGVPRHFQSVTPKIFLDATKSPFNELDLKQLILLNEESFGRERIIKLLDGIPRKRLNSNCIESLQSIDEVSLNHILKELEVACESQFKMHENLRKEILQQSRNFHKQASEALRYMMTVKDRLEESLLLRSVNLRKVFSFYQKETGILLNELADQTRDFQIQKDGSWDSIVSSMRKLEKVTKSQYRKKRAIWDEFFECVRCLFIEELAAHVEYKQAEDEIQEFLCRSSHKLFDLQCLSEKRRTLLKDLQRQTVFFHGNTAALEIPKKRREKMLELLDACERATCDQLQHLKEVTTKLPEIPMSVGPLFLRMSRNREDMQTFLSQQALSHEKLL